MSRKTSPDHCPVQDTGRHPAATIAVICMALALAGLSGPVAGAVMPAGVETWGSIQAEQNMPAEPVFVAISGGLIHCAGLTANGSVVTWGDNTSGQLAGGPSGTGYRAVSAGSQFCMALAADGSIVQWGGNAQNAFSGRPSDAGYTAISAGAFHALALREDGSIVEWGGPDIPHTPPPGTGYTAIAAGGDHNLALTADGTIVQWGAPWVDAGTPPPGTGYRAIATKYQHSLALTANGTIVQWGPGTYLSPPPGDGYTAIAAGQFDGIALAPNGSIVTWGFVVDPPAGTGYQAIAAGDYSGIAIGPGTNTSLAAAPNSAVYGNAVTLTANVTSSEAGTVPDGVVTFRDGAEAIGTAVPDVTGRAVLSVNTLAAGSHLLTASFSGNQTFAGSTSSIVDVAVNQSSAGITVSGPAAAAEGMAARFTARVSPSPPGAGLPGGAVQFRIDGVPAGDPANCTEGIARYNCTLAAGVHTIGAEYRGDRNFTAGATGAVSVLVSPVPVISRFSPVSGSRGSVAKITVSGRYFQANATVNLTKGPSVIHARTKSVTVPGKIVATVKIPAKARTGKYHLSVTNPDGGKAVAARKFIVP